MARLCRTLPAVSRRLLRWSSQLTRSCASEHNQHKRTLLFTSGSPWCKRWSFTRLTMPMGAAAVLLLLLTIMSQSHAPRQNNKDYQEDAEYDLDHYFANHLRDEGRPFGPDIATKTYDPQKPVRPVRRKVDTWGHLRKIRRTASQAAAGGKYRSRSCEGKNVCFSFQLWPH